MLQCFVNQFFFYLGGIRVITLSLLASPWWHVKWVLILALNMPCTLVVMHVKFWIYHILSLLCCAGFWFSISSFQLFLFTLLYILAVWLVFFIIKHHGALLPYRIYHLITMSIKSQTEWLDFRRTYLGMIFILNTKAYLVIYICTCINMIVRMSIDY